MRGLFSIGVLVLLCIWNPAAHADGPDRYIKIASHALTTGDLSVFDTGLREKIVKQNYQAEVRHAGAIWTIEVLSDVALRAGHLVQARTIHASSVIYWTVGYSSQSQLIETLELNRAAKTAVTMPIGDALATISKEKNSVFLNNEKIAAGISGKKPSGKSTFDSADFKKFGQSKVQTAEKKTSGKEGAHAKKAMTGAEKKDNDFALSDKNIVVKSSATAGMTIAPIPRNEQAVCTKYPKLCQEKDKDVRTVEFLFATTRQASTSTGEKVSFTGARAKDLTFGAARVRIPETHEVGHIELPEKIGFWGLTIYETKLDEKKHFSIKSVVKLDEADWGNLIKAKSPKEALVFVHGYNNSFEDSLYRNAQIIWDLQYKRGPSILFTWASSGQTLDYVYDQQSALLARDAFIKVLRMLRDDYKIEKINVLAHSMGNLIVLDALANAERTQNPVRISELILAAPDVDRDYFLQIAPTVRKITAGMTLYCSAADKAMIVSRDIAKVPRAGDVPAEGPISLPEIETIDVTALGQEFLGLNHDVFASSRSVMNDIRALLNAGTRPPNLRSEARGVPEGSVHPKYWRYPN